MPYQRLTDVVPAGDYEGDKVDVHEMLGVDFIAERVTFRDGMNDKEFAVVQAYTYDPTLKEPKGKPFWFTCGAANVVEAFRSAQNKLPLVLCVKEIKTAKGRKALTIE